MVTIMEPHYASIIKAAREQKGLTQMQIAVALNVTRAAVGQWVRGTNSPSREHMLRLANLLDIHDHVIGKPKHMHRSVEIGLWELTASPQINPEGKFTVPVTSYCIGEFAHIFRPATKIHEYLYRPDHFEGNNNIYGIVVATDALYPRFEAGERIYADNNEVPDEGDYVVVERTSDEPGEGDLMRIDAIIGDVFRFERIKLAKVEILERPSIRALRRILPWNDLLRVSGAGNLATLRKENRKA